MQILGFWVTCGVKMMSLHHGWGWQAPQTASCIHIGHIQSVWAHSCYSWHTVSALHIDTHPNWLRFWGSGSLVESKWCHYVMVEADSYLKLLLTSILAIYKVFEHIDMLCIGIQYQPYAVLPTLLGSDFAVLGHLWSQNDVIMSWLRLTATSNCFCIRIGHIKNNWAHHDKSLTQFYPPYLAQILGLWVTCGVKMMSLCHGWGWMPPQTASHIHIRHEQSVWAHWYAVFRHTVADLHSYTHPTWLRFWGSGSLVESKWCHYVMIDADGHLKLLSASILDLCKGVAYIMIEGLHSFTHTTWLWFWGSGSLVESKWCRYVMVEADSHLKLLPH